MKSPSTTVAERTHRSPEQRIADLEKKIEAIKHRAERQKVKKSPVLRHVRAAVKSIDKAVKESSGDQATRTALGEARATLSACLQLSGVLVPAGSGGAPRRGRPAGSSNGRSVAPDDLLAYVSAHPGQRGEQIAEALGTDTTSMRPKMRRLIEDGKVKTQGARRGMTYSPA